MHMVSCLNRGLAEEYNGGHGTIFRSELNGHAVAIKTLRLYLTSDFDKRLSVCIFTSCTAEPPTDTWILGILQRSCCVEASTTPEHPTIAGCKSRRASARHDMRVDGPR